MGTVVGQGFEQSGPGLNGTTPTKGVGNTLYNFSTYRDGLNEESFMQSFIVILQLTQLVVSHYIGDLGLFKMVD